MQFGLFGFLMDQFVLMFITLGIGMVVGKALKLGVSGTLFVGLGIGWGVKKYASIIVANGSATEKMIKIAKKVISISVVDELFFTLFLIFFIATVGLLAADKIGVVVRKYGVKFIILGFLIWDWWASPMWENPPCCPSLPMPAPRSPTTISPPCSPIWA